MKVIIGLLLYTRTQMSYWFIFKMYKFLDHSQNLELNMIFNHVNLNMGYTWVILQFVNVPYEPSIEMSTFWKLMTSEIY